MGWRFRKRINILPGVHINVSKSGISTNIGIRGASVTFGPKGTYVNTGIPNTGLYRRDKIYIKGSTPNYKAESSHYQEEKPHPVHVFKEYDKKTSLLIYNPLHYLFYFMAMIFPISAFIWYLNGFGMTYSSLINAAFQVILGLAIILNMSIKTDTSSYRIESIKETSEITIRKEILGHKIRCLLSILLAMLNLFPILSISGVFVQIFVGYEKTWDGGFTSILISLLTIWLWVSSFNKEKEFIGSLEDALLMKANGECSQQTVLTENTNSIDEIIDNNESETISNNKAGASAKQEESLSRDISECLAKSDNISSPSTEQQQAKEYISQSQEDILEPYDPKRDLEKYHYPTMWLLNHALSDRPYVDITEIRANQQRIVDTLRNFGVELSSIKTTKGARVILYEITLASGIHASKMRGLEDDIALALSSHNVKFQIPIPGKGTIGIEVPNPKPTVVSMVSIVNSIKFRETQMDLPCAIGKTITDEVFMFDLTKAPHILISGSTGQGKSVALNTMIVSLLYRKHPAEMKLVLMDPYGAEFGLYNQISKHFLASIPDEPAIVSNCSQAVRTLDSLCKEMDTRYDLLKMAYVSNIKEYNRKFVARQLNPNNGHRFMPYIVVIIDEYGDIIEEKRIEFETSIVRLAKFARAVGIHLILSTKRPTNDIITGTIKANFPTRIAFRLPERVDSQVILDCNGAEELLGDGDMLYRAGKSIDCVRIQGAIMDMAEIERVNEYISEQDGYSSVFELPDPYYNEDDYYTHDDDMQHLDSLFEDAARLIVREQSGSTSLIQRKFAIGYNRAGRLMDQLEMAGIVGAAHGSRPREVLIMDETSLDNLLNRLK